MGKRCFLVILTLVVSLSFASASSQSLSNVSLDALCAYHYTGDGDYFKGMGNASSWRFGGGVSLRLWWVDFSFLALSDSSYSDADTLLTLLPTLGLSIPLSSVADLEVGFGPGMGLLLPKQSSSGDVFSFLLNGDTMVTSVDFATLFTQSLLYWKAGVALKIGNFGVHLAYLCPTAVTFASMMAGNTKVGDYFQTSDGLLGLSLSFDLY